MKKLLSLFLFLCITGTLLAQAGKLRGNVFDKETGEPIIFGTVRVEGTDLGTNTDVDGFFNFAEVPVGTYNVVATYVGYDSVALEVTIKENTISYKQLYMQEGGINLEAVQVSAEREKARTEVKVSTVTITPRQIRALPSAGGEPDIAQYLTVLPGVIVTGDQGGQLYIRGGSPVQNKILLDGMTIYNPFHSIGLFSVFETETVRNVEVLTGGFNAEYGGRISAVVDIKTREGNKKRLSGLVSGSPFQGKVLLEGPISKLSDEGGSSTSFLLTAKHSLIDRTSKSIYDYAAPDSLGLPFQYTDLYGKLSLVTGGGSKLNLFGFNFTDDVDFGSLGNIGWDNAGGGLQFTLVPAASAMIVNGNASFSRYDINLVEADGVPRSSAVSSFIVGLDFTYFNNDDEIKYGIEVNGFNTDFTFVNFLGNTLSQKDFNTELAAFFKYRMKLSNLIFEPSLRVQYYASLPEFSVEPRLGLKYNISDNIRFKLAGGLYSQNLISAVNEEDIVNLFVGFLSGPDETIFKLGSTEATDHKLQKAWHAITGVEFDFGRHLTLNVEPYYKKYTQLINLNRNKLAATDPDFATEEGEAYGIDFLIKYNLRRLNLWGTYSLGYVNRFDGEQEYPTIFDRRHNVNFLASYAAGPTNAWEFSLRWNMGSGFPFTQTQGFFGDQTFEDGVNTDVTTNNPDLGVLYSDTRNGGRLPYYHRMDLSIKRTFNFSKTTKLELTASATNIYDRDNIFFFDRVRYERVDQLPIIPSLSGVFKF